MALNFYETAVKIAPQFKLILLLNNIGSIADIGVCMQQSNSDV